MPIVRTINGEPVSRKNPLPTANQGGVASKVAVHFGEVPVSTPVTVFNEERPLVIEGLLFSAPTRDGALNLKLEVRQEDGTWATIGGSTPTSANTFSTSFGSVDDWGHALYEVAKSDAESNRYSLRLRRPLPCPAGARLSLINSTAAPVAMGVRAVLTLL